MIKYFYYIWNLLKSNEKMELFYHYGQCLLSAILYTITDWQYLIILWAVAHSTIDNVLHYIIGIQLFTLIVGFWYYFVKHKIMSKQNHFYKLLSNRHYAYVLNRICNNASYQWINEKSTSELSKQLDSTDKGLQYIFSFLTQSVRLFATIIFSLIVISMNYKICGFIFIIFFIFAYYAYHKGINIFVGYDKTRNDFRLTNQHNSLIISDNISLLFDSVLHNKFFYIVKNILTFNSFTKTEQVKMYANENKLYIQIGIFLLLCYIITLISVPLVLGLTFTDFTFFFIASLLTYKCINHNLNELCDMYTNIRQSEIDFDTLEDIWTATKTSRPKIESIELPKYELNYDNVMEYNKYKFDKYDIEIKKCYEKFIEHCKLNVTYRKFHRLFVLKKSCTNDFESKEQIDYYIMKKFIYSNYMLAHQFYKYSNEIDLVKHDDFDIYQNYIKNMDRKDIIYNIELYKLKFCYPSIEYENLFSIKYKNYVPIIFSSNSHIVVDGVSGSGKTTLLRIIRGILPIETERNNEICLNINIDDNNYTNVLWQNISDSIYYCQQNSFTFNRGTIYQILSDNYIDTKNNDDCRLMKYALHMACVDRKFMDLDFKCSKNCISGGQKQRLILAKTLFRIFKKDKQIIILDEIDMGLDLETAKKILINLMILFKDRMLIIVLHTQELKILFKNFIHIKNGCISVK